MRFERSSSSASSRATHLERIISMRLLSFVILLALACGRGEAARGPGDSVGARAAAAPAAQRDSGAGRATTDTGRAGPVAEPGIVRGLYVNRFAAQSAVRMRQLIAVADSTEINAFVIDLKDEFGLNYRSADSSIAKNAGSHGAVKELRALLDTLKAHHILPIARMVGFQDPVAAGGDPER